MMKVLYPDFQAHYEYEELVEHFYLQAQELEFINRFRGDANRQMVAVLLKSLEHLGYFPNSVDDIPASVRTFIAHHTNRGLAQGGLRVMEYPNLSAIMRDGLRLSEG